MNDCEVIDRNGKRVTRPNGILQDGDFTRVKMTMMDSADPRLVAAAALADAVKRNEKFDYAMQGHRPGYGTQQDATLVDAVNKARADRDTVLTTAWQNSPSVLADGSAITAIEKVAVVGPSAGNDALFAARDQVIANRDRQLEAAWAK